DRQGLHDAACARSVGWLVGAPGRRGGDLLGGGSARRGARTRARSGDDEVALAGHERTQARSARAFGGLLVPRPELLLQHVAAAAARYPARPSRTSRTLFASASGVNGFCRKAAPASRRPSPSSA